jgi:glycosyltransferase involved in cell wall biosynthesis
VPVNTVAVSIPYYGCPFGIRRAVDAVLAQTHKDLICVVTNDGDTERSPWPKLADIADPRLVRYDAPANRGRYFTDAVVLAATDTPWFTVHDADDAAHPRWLELCLVEAVQSRADSVLTGQYVLDLKGRRIIEKPKMAADGREMHHFGHMAGLWRSSWLRRVGGPNPHFRVGYDTLLSTIAWHYGRYAALPAPVYTRYRRRGSLTTSRQTGGKSDYRLAVRAELRDLWADLRHLRTPEHVGAMLRLKYISEYDQVEREAATLARRMQEES